MTPRERYLTAINNEIPDHLPCQVHSWMQYYLKNYLPAKDQFEAYDMVGMDYVIYAGVNFVCDEKDLANWRSEHRETGIDASGNTTYVEKIATPSGTLTQAGAYNEITGWTTEYLIKSKEDFEIFIKHIPVPVKADFTDLKAIAERVGDKGIVRGGIWGYGQAGAWQGFCRLVNTTNAIYYAMDDPEWAHYALRSLVDKQLRVIELMKGAPLDLIETGGGAGSNTVISPKLHEEFCLPYDRQQHDALHQAGFKVVYHLCGGLMQMLDLVAQNHADGLETMTPPSMGGDCDLAEATRRVGDRLFFVGGFDQNRGFEKGDPETVRKMVRELHAACPDGGYICCASDHFFSGDPENIRAFVRACAECVY